MRLVTTGHCLRLGRAVVHDVLDVRALGGGATPSVSPVCAKIAPSHLQPPHPRCADWPGAPTVASPRPSSAPRSARLAKWSHRPGSRPASAQSAVRMLSPVRWLVAHLISECALGILWMYVSYRASVRRDRRSLMSVLWCIAISTRKDATPIPGKCGQASISVRARLMSSAVGALRVTAPARPCSGAGP